MSENKINTADVEKSSEVVNTTESTQKAAVSTKVTDKPKKVKKPNELLKVFTNGIIKDNALLVMLLGLCPLFPSTIKLVDWSNRILIPFVNSLKKNIFWF